MTDKYGIQITDPDVDLEEAIPEEYIFNSEYRSLRISSRGSGSINSTSGGGLVTIPHGLGYVPAFLVHVDPGQSNNYYIAPYVPTGIFGTPLIYAYADPTNLYIKADSAGSNTNYTISDDNCMYREGGGFQSDGGATIGDISGTTWRGALRYQNISLSQGASVTSATLNFYGGEVGAGNLDNMYCYGIDEDNTDVFNNPFSRTKTTASTLLGGTVPSVGNYYSINVKSQVEEIVDRGGWSSGNAMGFTIIPLGDESTGYMFDDNDGTNSYLNVVTTTATVANYKYTIFLNQLE